MVSTSEQIGELIPRLLACDRQAEERFFQLAYGRLMAWAAWDFFVPESDREDFALEVIEKVLSRLHRFNPQRAAFTTWMFAIARNHAIDRFSKRCTEKDPLHDAGPAEVLEWVETATAATSTPNENPDPSDVSPLRLALQEAVSKMPEHDKELLRMVFGTTLTAAQIGEQMHITSAAVRKRKERLLEKLRTLLSGRPAAQDAQ